MMTTWETYIAAVDATPLAPEVQKAGVGVLKDAGFADPKAAVGGTR